MDVLAWTLYAFITAALLVAVLTHYRLREPPGRGRGLLAGLRAAGLALLVLLLFDPVLPVAGGRTGDTVVLLDESLSMGLPEAGGEDGGGTRWEAARGLAAELVGGRVLAFGDAVEAGALPEAPRGVRSLLEPGIRAAAEAGGRRVVVVTDGGLEDGPAALALAERSGVAVEIRRVGETDPVNAGIVEVEAPGWLEVGEEAAIEVAVATIGDGSDSLVVVLREGGRELARARLAPPPAGRLAGGALRFTPSTASAAPVRLDIVLEGGDAAPEDDVRSVYVRIEEDPGGVALVSFMPDQEPRFLLPVLERALGVPVRGWMALPGGRYIRLGAGPEAGTAASEAAARRAVEEADLVVLHGMTGGAPAWARDAAASATRLLVFPGDGAVPGLPFEPGALRGGDWYPAAELPSSPLAPLLAGLEPGDAPPLGGLRQGAPPAGWWGPLDARLGRRGDPLPVVVAGSVGARRIAVAMGEGYWRWAFAGAGARETYDRLWSALGGWLIEEVRGVAAEAIAPVPRVVPRGDPVRFRVPPGTDSVRLRLSAGTAVDGADAAIVEGVLEVRGVEAVAGTVPPGHYRYEARAYAGDGSVPGAGALTVESYSPELTRRAVALRPAETDQDGRSARGARPLRSSLWPWLLLVGLFSAEWVLRRRWGLR